MPTSISDMFSVWPHMCTLETYVQAKFMFHIYHGFIYSYISQLSSWAESSVTFGTLSQLFICATLQSMSAKRISGPNRGLSYTCTTLLTLLRFHRMKPKFGSLMWCTLLNPVNQIGTYNCILLSNHIALVFSWFISSFSQ